MLLISGTNGNFIISCEELSLCKDELTLQFIGKKLDKKDFFGSSDPFLSFFRSNEGGNYTLVHKTEHINNNVNPTWKKFSIPIRTLCNGDLDRNIKVECYDHNNSGNHSLIGEFYFTVRQLLDGPGPSNEFDVINPKKKVSSVPVNYINTNILLKAILYLYNIFQRAFAAALYSN